MKLRLAAPAVLVDVGRIAELSYIRDEGDEDQARGVQPGEVLFGLTSAFCLSGEELVGLGEDEGVGAARAPTSSGHWRALRQVARDASWI
jgi:hypothetical protein